MDNHGTDQIPDAYDAEGRPLYYHPPEANNLAPEAVAMPNDEPVAKVDASPDESLTKLKHDRSVAEFPSFNLQDDEYVEVIVPRHPAALMLIWIGEFVVALVLVALWFLLTFNSSDSLISDAGNSFLLLIIIGIMALLIAAGFISHYVFYGNKFVITNQRVIQQIMSGLLFRDFQTTELRRIEDISYKQAGILQYTFNYGTLRLSTVGDENTYTFTCVKDPAEQVRQASKIIDTVRPKTTGDV